MTASTRIGVLVCFALTAWLTAASAQAPPVRIRGTVQSLDGQVLTVVTSGTGVDLLRAGAAAIWNSGMPIYALEVPPALYGE